MDETESPAYHRWVSFCRLFMMHHPRVGAELYSNLLGFSPGLYRAGWNAIRHAPESEPLYVHIGAGGGRTTPYKPEVPDTDIHRVSENEIPQLLSSHAYRNALIIVERFDQDQKVPISRQEGIERLLSIARLSQVSIFGDNAIVTDHRRRAKAGWQLGLFAKLPPRSKGRLSGTTLLSLEDVSLSATRIIREYLRFEMPGVIACLALASVLRDYCFSRPVTRDIVDRVYRQLYIAKHLGNRAYILLRDRNKMNLSSFYDMTYLAILYGRTAKIILETLLANNDIPEAYIDRTQRLALGVEERIVHLAIPSLSHPAFYYPVLRIEVMHTMRFPLPNSEALYPGVSYEGLKAHQLEKVVNGIKSYSKKAGSISVLDTLNDENSPFDKWNKELITSPVFQVSDHEFFKFPL